ncbi:translocation protein TolB [Aquisphaera giovannonii]|uniref:Translocation protein TolB n=1 Tax=Aquisphaera giovannonii TaxID=406548 RepID=A0A5B9WAG9_9BACT|nr:PD40 domain-containing protein [Aquisphaera giovannonii]QEH37546.1 translocation protein TolB [Aquisphaera giovannonii]
MPASLLSTALVTIAALAAQPPSGRPLSAEEVAKLESKHLTNIRQVTFGFFRAGEGYFRPDGKGIIFQAVPPLPESVLLGPAENQYEYQIYTAELSPNAKPVLVSTGKGACTCSFYHPDGKSILYGSTHLNPSPARPQSAYARSGSRYRWSFPEGMDIFRADPDGKNLARITTADGYDAEGSYSPDGKQIIFTSFRDGDADIFVMDADGENVRPVVKAKGYDGGPFFSPDGKRIIYRSDRKGNDLLQIYVNNLEGTAERALTSNDAVNWGPFWHPDSTHIVYSTSRHGHSNYELYLMNVDTGAEERLTYHDGFDGLPVVSPDGNQLMWTSNARGTDRNSQLFIADFRLSPAPQTAAAR